MQFIVGFSKSSRVPESHDDTILLTSNKQTNNGKYQELNIFKSFSANKFIAVCTLNTHVPPSLRISVHFSIVAR